MKKVPLQKGQKDYLAVEALNLAYTAYRMGDMETCSSLLGMCEECVEALFETLGIENGEEYWGIDIDTENNMYAFIFESDEDEEVEVGEFDIRFWAAQLSDFDA